MKIVEGNIEGLKLASKALINGELVAFPTETVYGAGCIYNNLDALNKLNALKHRPPEKPYTVMLSSVKDINKYADIDDKTYMFLSKILPGSVTVLLKAKKSTWEYAKKDNIIGIRIPSSLGTLSLLKLVNKPLLVPSLNRAGEAPIKDIALIEKDFKDEISVLVKGDIKENIPSTVISLVNGIKLIREGKVPFNYLKEKYFKI